MPTDQEVTWEGPESTSDELSRIPAPENRSETEAVMAWRLLRASQLGCAETAAVVVSQAQSWEIDLHDLAGLVERGCDPDLAVEVLR